MKFFYALTVLLATSSSSTTANAQQSIRHLRSIPHARVLISDAILSSVHSSDGVIDPSIMEKATAAGIPADFIEKVALEAYQKVTQQGVAVSQIEDDMKELRQQEEEQEQEEKLQQQEGDKQPYKGYQPSARWNMSTQAHIALSKAVMSGFRSPTETIDPQLLEEASSHGVSLEVIRQSLDSMLESRKNIMAKQQREQQQKQPSDDSVAVRTTMSENSNFAPPSFLRNDNSSSTSSSTGTVVDARTAAAAGSTTASKPPRFEPSSKKDFLSTNSLKALSRAVLSGFRSPTGEMDPQLVQDALEKDCTMEQLYSALDKMNSKRSESTKKKQQEEQQQQQGETQVAGTTTTNLTTTNLRGSSSSSSLEDLSMDLLAELVEEIVEENVATQQQGKGVVTVTDPSTVTIPSNLVATTTTASSSEVTVVDPSSQEQKEAPPPSSTTTIDFTYADEATDFTSADEKKKKDPAQLSRDEMKKHIAFADLSRAAQMNEGKVEPKLIQAAVDAGVPRNKLLITMEKYKKKKNTTTTTDANDEKEKLVAVAKTHQSQKETPLSDGVVTVEPSVLKSDGSSSTVTVKSSSSSNSNTMPEDDLLDSIVNDALSKLDVTTI